MFRASALASVSGLNRVLFAELFGEEFDYLLQAGLFPTPREFMIEEPPDNICPVMDTS
jgi:hypothetical protein